MLPPFKQQVASPGQEAFSSTSSQNRANKPLTQEPKQLFGLLFGRVSGRTTSWGFGFNDGGFEGLVGGFVLDRIGSDVVGCTFEVVWKFYFKLFSAIHLRRHSLHTLTYSFVV